MLKRITNLLKKNRKWILLSIAMVIVVLITEDVFESEIIKHDTIAYGLVVNYIRADWLTPIVKVITWLGSATALIIISFILLVVIKNRKIGLCIISNLIGITILNQIFKYVVQRPRPEGYRLVIESGYSFPSGHSMVSTAFYGLLIFFVYKYIKNRTLKNIIYLFLSLLIIGICCSRVYLGAHYASDVIGGFFTSIAYLTIFITVVPKLIGDNDDGKKEEKID